MRVMHENYKDYEEIQDCKYQKAFPFMNKDELDVICTYGVDVKDIPAYKYAPLCSDCTGKNCGKYKKRGVL